MSTYRLQHLFAPRSVALVGASPRARSLGHAVLRNLREADFRGSIHLVNPNRTEIDGLPVSSSLQDLPEAPELVVVASPAESVLDVIRQAAAKGARTAVVLTAGLDRGIGSACAGVEAVARSSGLRVVGPNCFGVIA